MKSWTVLKKDHLGNLSCSHVSAPMGGSAAYQYIRENYNTIEIEIIAIIPGAQEIYDAKDPGKPLPIQK